MIKPKVSVFIATSVDGYIARPDGNIDWLDQASSKAPPGEDCGYSAFIKNIDCLVLGSNSFKKVLEFDFWPYENLKTIVMSRGGIEIPEKYKDKATVSNLNPVEFLESHSKEGIKNIYLDGGQLIQSFLREGLVDEITITKIPVLLGKGISLFGDLSEDIALEILDTKVWDFGFFQVKYKVS